MLFLKDRALFVSIMLKKLMMCRLCMLYMHSLAHVMSTGCCVQSSQPSFQTGLWRSQRR